MRVHEIVSGPRVVPLALAVLLLAAAPAWASSPHPVAVVASGGILGSVFSSIGHALLGAFSWTVGLASKFLLTTLAALVKLLIPHSWVHKGLQIMQWVVAMPNYAGKVTTPGGGQSYGFAGINALRDLFMWLGVAIAPLTLVYATSRAMIGDGDPVAIPILRMLAVAALIASYPYWWSQASAMADQVSNAILTVPDVSRGLNKLMEYAVGGVALGGWQLIDLALMGAIGLALLGLIFLKVVLILLGALLYATGPLTIGLVPTRAGGALARAWGSAVVTLLGLGVAWAAIFAVGAVLISDAGSAAPLIAGNSSFGSLVGGLLLAVAGLATLWICLRAGREAGALLRGQLGGLFGLALHHGAPSPASTGAPRPRASGPSIREYGTRLARTADGATQRVAGAGTAGAALVGVTQAAAHVGRRGLLGTAFDGLRNRAARPGATPTPGPAQSRAGVVAARAARNGTAHTATGSSQRRDSHRPQPGRIDRGPNRTEIRSADPASDRPPGAPPAAPDASSSRSRPAGSDAGGGPRSPEATPPAATHSDAAQAAARPASPRPSPADGAGTAAAPPRSTSTHGSPVRTGRAGTQRRWSGRARPTSPDSGANPPPRTPDRPEEDNQ